MQIDFRILLVDDHRVVSEGVRGMLANTPHLQVVGAVNNGAAAVRECAVLKPDIVVMDIQMPGMNGLDAAREILARNPDIRIIALSGSANQQTVRQMLQCGMRGCVLKSEAMVELNKAIRVVMEDAYYFCREAMDMIIRDYMEWLPHNSGPDISVLSEREKEVLTLIAKTRTTPQIADMLGISQKTVESHRLNLMRKLGIHNLADLVKYALLQRLVPLEISDVRGSPE